MKHGESYCHLLSNFIQILENLFKEIYKDLEINGKTMGFFGKKKLMQQLLNFYSAQVTFLVSGTGVKKVRLVRCRSHL